MRAETLRTILALSRESAPEDQTCRGYEKCFYGLAQKLKESGSFPEAGAASLLGGICSMMFSNSRSGNPWGPMWTDHRARKRSMEADDLEKEQLDALGEVVAEIGDPELRARIADGGFKLLANIERRGHSVWCGVWFS